MQREVSETVTGSAIQVIRDRENQANEEKRPEVLSSNQNANAVTVQPGGGAVGTKLADVPGTQLTTVGAPPKLSPSTIIATVSVILLMIGGAAGIYIYNNKPFDKPAALKAPPPAVTVTTAVSKERVVDDNLIVTGSVSAWDPLSVGAEVGGLRITAVNVEEGDHVKKGQVLATLNSALLRTQLEQAKARLASNEASLKKSIQPNRSEEVRGLQAALAQAEATTSQEQAQLSEAKAKYVDAKVNAQRYRNLAKMGANSRQDAESKQLSAETAQQEVASCGAKIKAAQFMEDQARERLLLAQRGGRNEDIDISRAVLAETRAQIKQLEEQIAETVIVAPDDGLISLREAHIGDITTAGKSLFAIIRLSKLELRAQVSDLDLAKFKPGQVVNITTTEESTKQIKGVVKLVSPQVDALTRLGIVRIALPVDQGLKPGMFARADVSFGKRKAVTVPVGSVIARNGGSFVFKLDGDKVLSCPVIVGNQNDTYAEIVSGLPANQKVVLQGARFLSDRDTVRVVD